MKIIIFMLKFLTLFAIGVFLLTIVPFSFGAFPDKSTIDDNAFTGNTDVRVWTDKDHYRLGETVYVEGKFGSIFTKDINFKNANQEILVGITDRKIIQVNDDGTFSTSIKLSNSLDGLSGTKKGIAVYYCKYQIEYCDINEGKGLYPSSWDFFVGEFTNKPFSIEVKENGSGYNLIQDGKIINNLASTRDKFLFSTITPSGMPIKSSIGSISDHGMGFGKYELRITHGDIIKKIPFEKKRQPTEFAKIWTSEGGIVNHSQNLRIDIDLIYPNPDNPNYTFKIIDFSGKTVFSGEGEFYASERNSSKTPSYNNIITVWSFINFDTNELSKISGEYKVEINYEGKIGSTTFEMKTFEKDFELKNIQRTFQIITNEHNIEFNFGEDFAERIILLLNANDIDQRIKAEKILFEKQKNLLEQTISDFEEDVKNWNVSIDEKTEILYEFRSISPKVIDKFESDFKRKIMSLEKTKLQVESREKAEIQSKIDQQKAEEEIAKEKEKIKQEILKDQPIKQKVPNWVKNNARWWSEGKIEEKEFVNAIQNLMKEKIITIQKIEIEAVGEEKVPDWVKNNAKWWSNGLLSEDEFLTSMEYLIKKGILRLSSNSASSSPTETTPSKEDSKCGAGTIFDSQTNSCILENRTNSHDESLQNEIEKTP